MKRSVRRKETIENNLTRSKKREESDENENDPFSRITLDLKMEIFMKLPPKSIAKLVFVSKTWASIIRSRAFNDLYMTRSSTRPRLLFKVHRQGKHFYQSCSQEDPSYHHQRLIVTQIRNPSQSYDFSPPSGGLVCCQSDSPKVLLVGNPSTGQFVPLPKVRTRRLRLIAFFGYDPVNHVYKVLCMTVKNVRSKKEDLSLVVSEEHQVYTLGAEEKVWRMINCQHPHRPHLPPYHTSNELCINGVLFYYAWIRNEASLISFDLRSEDFNVIKLPLPEDVRHLQEISCLGNYGGKIALMSRLYSLTLDLHVLEDAIKQEWSKVSILVPCGRDLGEQYRFKFKGALSTGELIFASSSFRGPFCLLSYDPKGDIAKKVLIEEIEHQHAMIRVYLDHVDTPLFLSNES